MDSLLDAIQEGRLIELPDTDKTDSLQFLAHIIEAIPSVPAGTDVAGLIFSREKTAITSIGRGFACPHARVSYDEDLICSVGWSPAGINYDAIDSQPVHIIVMYLVPDNQRNHYLKEISLLAKALLNVNVELVKSLKDLNEVRNYLLDLVNTSKSIVGSEVRAKMIQLEAKSALLDNKIQNLSNLTIETISIVIDQKNNPVYLTQSKELALQFEINLKNANNLVENLLTLGLYDFNGWRIIRRSNSEYQSNVKLIDCIAIKLT